MREDTTIPFRNPALRDELSELVREGAQRIIRQAVEAELEAFLEGYAADRDAQGRRAVVRNGYLPSREVLTGVGPVRVRVPRTRDRSGAGRCFRSELLPPYLKKTRRMEAVIPWLYLKGVSTNDFGEALTALFGESVKGLSPASVARLKDGWEREYAQWRERDWGGEEFVYLWADGSKGVRRRRKKQATSRGETDEYYDPSTNRKTLAAAHDAPGNAAPRRLRGGEPRGRGLAMPPGAGRGVCERIRGGPCSGAFRRAPGKYPLLPASLHGNHRDHRFERLPRLVRRTLQSRRGTRRRRGYGRTAIGAARERALRCDE